MTPSFLARALRRPLLSAAIASSALCLVALPFQEDEEEPAIDTARTTLEKWHQTRRILSKEKRDWAIGKELLEDRIDIVEREIESYRKNIEDAQGEITEADKKRAELDAENTRLIEAAATMGDIIGALEARVKALLVKLPEPLVERLAPITQQIPEDPAETDLSLSQRFGFIIAVMDQVNKFNREIHVESEKRDVGDGTTSEVTTIYLGIAKAIYSNSGGTAAGVGSPGAEGWIWTPQNDSALEISRAVAILEDEEIAGFVRVPMAIEAAEGGLQGADAGSDDRESDGESDSPSGETGDNETGEEEGQ